MQFAILLFINLILWALFYLVISLKLEKSASEFREKKLRREVDEIIREFNETAERNISLLENRISILKRLMARSGALRTVDIHVGNEDFLNSSLDGGGAAPDGPTPKAGLMEPGLYTDKGSMRVESFTAEKNREDSLSRRQKDAPDALPALMKKVIGRVRELKDSFIGGGKSGRGEAATDLRVYNPDGELPGVSAEDFPIEKDAREMPSRGFHEREKEVFNADEAQLTRMFMDAHDKYRLVGELYEKGCSMEIMSRCSGIPVGEIRLILNLNRSMEDESR